MIQEEVVFQYKNVFNFTGRIEVPQFDGCIIIDNKFLETRLLHGRIDDFQVFSFGKGMLVISDYKGNAISIFPSAGLIDAYNLLLAFHRRISLGNKTSYAVNEFYRIDPQEDEYAVSIDFYKSELKLTTYNNEGTFSLLPFGEAQVRFAKDIVEWYDKKYPLFLKSPVRAEILELKDKVIAENIRDI